MRTLRIGDLPDDMQVFIGDALEDAFDPDLTFTVLQVPTSQFPLVDAQRLDPSRGQAYALDMTDWSQLPPVLLCGRQWLDGMHRVYAAQAQGRPTVPAIDLAEHGHRLADTNHLGFLRRTPLDAKQVVEKLLH